MKSETRSPSLRRILGSLSSILLLLHLSVTQVSAQFILGYDIDLDRYDEDCQIYSGSVTIFNCPRTDTYDVILTEMLTNTTVSEIVNEVKGIDDKENDPSDTERDYIRRIQVTDVRVSLI